MKGVKKSNIGIGYKVFNSNWICRDFQYKVGEEYHFTDALIMCESGFHFCPNLINCFNYYNWDSKNKVAIIHYDITKTLMPNNSNKYVSAHIKIVKELKWDKVLELCNSGSGNSGNGNSGNWNSGNENSGFLNSNNPTHIRVFNSLIPVKLWEKAKIPNFFYFSLNEFIISENMSEIEKREHPYHKTLGGFLKNLDYKEAWKNSYNSASQEDKNLVKELPGFDANIFEDITGIKIE